MQTLVQSSSNSFNVTKYEDAHVRTRSESYAKTIGKQPRE